MRTASFFRFSRTVPNIQKLICFTRLDILLMVVNVQNEGKEETMNTRFKSSCCSVSRASLIDGISENTQSPDLERADA